VLLVERRELGAGHDSDAGLGARGAGLVDAVRGVVVGEREQLDAGPCGGADDIPGRERAI
jgi:hypothetical protein